MELKKNGAGAVEFILQLESGTRVKNQMSDKEAKELITTGNIQKKGNQIIVNDKFIFEIEGEAKEEPVAMPKEEPARVQEEPKKKSKLTAEEDKPLKEAVKEEKKKKPRTKKAKK